MSSTEPTVAFVRVPPDLAAVVGPALGRVWGGRITSRSAAEGRRPTLVVVGGPDVEHVWEVAVEVEERWPAVPCIAVVEGARQVRGRKRMPRSVAWALWVDELEAALLAVVLRYALEHGLRRRLEHQLEHDRAMVDVGWVASAVSHEIGNPLTSLLTNLEIVQAQLQAHVTRGEAIDPDACLGAVTDAFDGARHVSRIAQDLGRASRRGGRLALTEVRAVVETARRLAAEPLAGIEVRIASRRCRPVRVDETRLCQVFLNLLKNAAEALQGSPNPCVELSVEPDGDEVVIRVRDNGPGVPDEVAKRLFQPWFTTRAEGSGLGLALSQRYIEAMGGRMSLASEGAGAQFEVRLPASTRPIASRPTLVPDQVEVTSSILVVDDTPIVRRSIERALAPTHRVVLTADYTGAVAALERERFDILLLDLHMPEHSGIEVYQMLEDSFPGRAGRVVFLSGAFSKDDLAYLEQQSLPWVRKPVGAGELRDLVVELSSGAG